MAEIVAGSRDPSTARASPVLSSSEYVRSWRFVAICAVLLLINAFSQIDRILPFILAEKIKADLSLTDTQMGLLTGLAFAVCYALLSLPLARAADRGSPRLVLVSCVLIWSVMTTLGGFAASFMFLALTRFGVAFGEAEAVPAGHALIARKIEPERRGLTIGLFAMGIPLGTMAGFAAGGAIADTRHSRTDATRATGTAGRHCQRHRPSVLERWRLDRWSECLRKRRSRLRWRTVGTSSRPPLSAPKHLPENHSSPSPRRPAS